MTRRTLIAPGDGDQIGDVLVKLSGAETGGTIAIIEQTFGPRLLLPPHVHDNDVWLYLIEGEMQARVGDEVVAVTPGSWVLKPRRIPHTMWNPGSEPARLMELYTPGGFERFFADLDVRTAAGPLRLDDWNAIGKAHGIRFFDDWIPELTAKYGLHVISAATNDGDD